jgi:hypothetical protein
LETVDASPLWELINAKFGITEAQERYNLVRDMCSLEIQDSDYFTFQTKWQHFDVAARRLKLTYDDIHHDLFLQGLRNWQKHYVGIKLNEFFTTGTSNRPIQNIDLDCLKRELQNRATTPNQPHRDPRREPHRDYSMARKDVSKSRNHISANKSTSEAAQGTSNEEGCSYCRSLRHAPSVCWFKDLSLADPKWITQRFDGIKAVRHRNGDSTPALNELTPKPRARQARAPDPIGNRENRFDSGVSYHIVVDMFTSYTELPADTDAVTGAFTDNQKPIGIGSIRMNLGKRQFI